MKRSPQSLHAWACALALLAAAGSAHAQKIAPGLWENTVLMKTQSGKMEAARARMQERLASMPPEQRKMMEDNMARQGVSMGGGAGKPITVRLCITPEQAARDEIPQREGHCKQVSKDRSGNVLHVKFACEGEHPSSGEGTYTFVSDKEHKGHVVIDTTVQGKPERMEIDQTGHWVSADCGDLKPRGK